MYHDSVMWIAVLVSIAASVVLAVLWAILWREVKTTQDICDVRSRNNECIHNAIQRDSAQLWRTIGDMEDSSRDSCINSPYND